MPKKFDTNPLDPEFPKKAKEAQTKTLPKQETAKTEPPSSVTEETTRTFDQARFAAYQNNFNTAQHPTAYETARLKPEDKSSTRKVAKVGLPENILIALPYIPFYIGLIAGILELLFVPKSETKVRYHAAQGLAAHLGILIVTTVLGVAGNVTDIASFGNFIFQLVTTIMLVVFAIKAWQGKPVHIESVDDLTEWLEDKIKPQN